MKKYFVKKMVLVLVGVLLLSGCSSGTDAETIAELTNIDESVAKDTDGLTTDYERHFDEPASQRMSNMEGIVGDYDTQFVELQIPENTFDEEVTIEITNPESIPQLNPEDGTPLGSPLEISIDREKKRLSEEVIIKLKLTQEELAGLVHEDEIMVAYYNGENWDYMRPKEVNLEEGYVTIGTYHFSKFWAVEPTKEKRLSDFLSKRSKADWAISQGASGTSSVLEKMVNDLVAEKFGVVDKSFTQDVIEGLMKQGDITSLLVTANDAKNSGDDKTMDALGLELNTFVGKEMFSSLEKLKAAGKLKDMPIGNALGKLADNAGKINTGFTALTEWYNGNTDGALKAVSKEIIGSFPPGKVLTAGAEVIERQINRWKNDKLEAAYKIYLNGASSWVPWGYNVEKGNFDELFEQMDGLRREVYIDAIEEYATLHDMERAADGTPLTDMLGEKTLNNIREKAKNDLRKVFEERSKREDEVAKFERANKELIEAFENAKLLTNSKYGYDEKEMSMEERLEELFVLKNRILKDTSRELGFSGGGDEKYIEAGRVARLAQLLKMTDGEKRYQDELIELGYKEKMPANLSGSWSGSIVITSVPTETEIEACGGTGELNFEEMLGMPMETRVVLNGSDGMYTGTLTVIVPMEDWEPAVNTITLKQKSETIYELVGDDVTADLTFTDGNPQTLGGALPVELFGLDLSLVRDE
ncbi:hypothetical protein JR334_06655 [Clostridia bacterium]|nr:hypothetical protein JR334_06655 [Clostridia bacterium]